MPWTSDTHLPTSCAFCANLERKRIGMCHFCRRFVCPDHGKLVRKKAKQRRPVRCCTECQKYHADEYTEIVK